MFCLAVIPFDDEEEDGINRRNLYGSSFRTFDARNYNCLATIDAKRSISDLCTGDVWNIHVCCGNV